MSVNLEEDKMSGLHALLKQMQEDRERSRIREDALIAMLKEMSVANPGINVGQGSTDHGGISGRVSGPAGSVYEVLDACSESEVSRHNVAGHEARFSPTAGAALSATTRDERRVVGDRPTSCRGDYMNMPTEMTRDLVNDMHSTFYPTFPGPPFVASLPQLQLRKFSGDLEHYHIFVQEFKAFVESQCHDYHRKLLYLQMYLTGEPSKLVQNCLAYPDKAMGYHRAWELLNGRYGNSFRLRNKIREELMSGPPIDRSNAYELNCLATRMNSCQCLFEATGRSAELDSPELLRALLKRLPICMQEKFAELSFSREVAGLSTTFSDLTSIVFNSAKFSETEWAQQVYKAQASNNNKAGSRHKRINDQKPASKTFVVSQQVVEKDQMPTLKVCAFCEADHHLWRCDRFGNESVSARKLFVSQKRLCFNCLKSGHRASDCKFKGRCRECDKRHNSLLHDNTITTAANNGEKSSNQSSVVELTNQMVSSDSKRTYLSIVPVHVWANDGSTTSTYALLDTGSTTSLCTNSLAKKLHLSVTESHSGLQGVNSLADSLGQVGPLSIKGLEEHESFRIQTLGVIDSLPDMRRHLPLGEITHKYRHLCDIKIGKPEAVEIELLIGMNAQDVFRIKEQRCGNVGDPIAWHVGLGWTIFGSDFGDSLSVDSGEHNKVCLAVDCGHSTSLNEQVMKLFEHDFRDLDDQQQPEMSVEDKRAVSIMENSIAKRGDHYVMNLPWREGNETWPSNRVMAEKRLKSLKTKLSSNNDLRDKYFEKMNAYLQSGHASIAPEKNFPGRTWYLPHHCTGNKFRVVFDCAAKYRGSSLNDRLLQGPDLSNNLTGVLLRFRQDPVAFAADIRSMFHQVFVEESDRDSLRFLWWKDGDWSKPPIDYRMNVLLFGSTCSPSCAAFALQQTAQDNITNADETTVQTVMNNFYVDDLLKSCPTIDMGQSVIKQLNPLLESGGFHLTKFVASTQDVLKDVPECDRVAKEKDLSLQGSATEKALGVFWNTETDRLTVKVDVEEKPLTRRGLLSMINQVHDVLGLVQPFILPARKLLQEACRDQSDWDEPVPAKLHERWKTWVTGLKYLAHVSVPRSFKLLGLVCVRKELHVFCDASTFGYGAVCFVRTIYADQTVNCVFCMGKSRVAPLKPVSVPRLELTAATIGVKLSAFICNQLEFEFSCVYFWTDAVIVLRYIRNTASRFHTFVANRVHLIQSLTSPDQWRYVPTDCNPADIASRGLMPNKVDTADLWFNGPPFLLEYHVDWPEQPEITSTIQPDDEEAKKDSVCSLVQHSTILGLLLQQFSEYSKIVKTIAWLTRFKLFLRWKHSSSSAPPTGDLSVNEVMDAKNQLLRLTQWEAFPEAMRKLSAFKNTEKRLSWQELSNAKCFRQIRKLNPFLGNGLMRVGGRLQNSALAYSTQHPVILPPNHAITKLLIMKQHDELGHSGVSHVLNSLRQQYWIVRGRAAVRKALTSCFRCRAWSADFGKQRMADLPEARVVAGERPFSCTGVDLMGPLTVKQGRNNLKRYVVLFTCLASRAVHLEVAQSLEASAFIQAFQRFISRRGKPRIMFSDNGTNFRGAEIELNKGIKAWNSQQMQTCLRQKEIEWRFNTPACSHAGGVWERLIRSVRKHFRLVVGETKLDDFELVTFAAEVERILNDRPLTDVSTDPDDLTALTPSMLLHGIIQPSLPADVCTKKDLYRKSWQKGQALADQFWSRWLEEYLPSLQPRQKWFGAAPNINVGDLVMIKDHSVKRGCWPKAIVEECYPGADGLIRKVRLRTANGVLTRDIRSICLLEEQM